MKSGIYTVSHGAHIYYEREGKGRPIVLIHGWGCSGRFYNKNVEGLKDRYEVITMDMRGHGRSSKMLDGYSIGSSSEKTAAIWLVLDLLI